MFHPRCQQTITLNRSRFRRRTRVSPEVFADMLEALHIWHRRTTRAGRPPALRLEEQLMRSLEFWREERTFSHLGQDWGVYEATAHRAVVRVEDALLASGRFSLPGRRTLHDDPTVWTAVLVDVSEIPCERPKKTRNAGTAARTSAIP
jgi:Helix-turn-helix of DDE superfamily endonuclease